MISFTNLSRYTDIGCTQPLKEYGSIVFVDNKQYVLTHEGGKLLEEFQALSAEEQAALLEASRGFFDLARLETLTIDADAHAPKASASNVVRGCEVIVLLDGAVDFQAELARLDKEIGKVDKDLVALNGKLSNENFVSRAPEAVVNAEREKAEKKLLMKLQEAETAVKDESAWMSLEQLKASVGV